jgi:DNA-binding response OmpR family regulator
VTAQVSSTVRAPAHVAIIGRGADTETEGGVAYALRELGAEVRRIGLRDRAHELVEDDEGNPPRALVVDPGDRMDLAAEVLRAARAVRALSRVGALLLVDMGHAARIDPGWGFDDFLVRPFGADELYARIRSLEWGRSDFTTDERHKVGSIVVDRARHEVTVEGREVSLTAKEFGLLACFCERRGVVMSRTHLLGEVWGASYQGGPRTVDIHVRRLRAKLGAAFPLDTLRGWGYRLRTPETD